MKTALLVAIGMALLWGAPQASKAPAKKTPAAKKTTPKKTTTASSAKKAPAKKRARTSSSRRRTPSFRAGQQKPAPERYSEIQAALKERGYLSVEADGKWGETSTEALKRFQKDQNLKPDGKITSLSLIALGLGPKRNALPPPAVNPQPPPEPLAADPAASATQPPL
ncbi:MAG: peptidoglycan-binding protein [Acidimicrobiia bacterium]|nr:peptidoglycan-binding protein [Acidimicrobiia bacterium]